MSGICKEDIIRDFKVEFPQTPFQVWAIHEVVKHALEFSYKHDQDHDYDTIFEEWRQLLHAIEKNDFKKEFINACEFCVNHAPYSELNLNYYTGCYGVRVGFLENILMASQYKPLATVGQIFYPSEMTSQLLGFYPSSYGVNYQFKVINSYGNIEYIEDSNSYSSLYHGHKYNLWLMGS